MALAFAPAPRPGGKLLPRSVTLRLDLARQTEADDDVPFWEEAGYEEMEPERQVPGGPLSSEKELKHRSEMLSPSSGLGAPPSLPLRETAGPMKEKPRRNSMPGLMRARASWTASFLDSRPEKSMPSPPANLPSQPDSTSTKSFESPLMSSLDSPAPWLLRS